MQPKEMPFSIDRDADTPLVEQFVAGVSAAIASGHFRRGDRLPTIEEWSERLGVSSWVPRKGLARLVAERLVVVKKHVGAVVLGEAPLAPKGRVLYVTIDTGNLYSRNVMAFWMGHVCANAGYRFDHVSVPSTPCGGDEFARLKQVLYDGVDFAVFDGVRRGVEVTSLFAERDIPYVTLGWHDGEKRGDAVALRGASLADEIVGLIVKAGLRRVIQVGYGLWFGDAVTEKLFSHGLLIERLKLPPVTRDGTVEAFQRAAVEEFSRRLAKGRAWLPDVFVFTDDSVATGALLALSAHGVRIPEDVRVITMSNKGFGPVYTKSLTRYERDNRALGIAIAKYILARLVGRKPTPPVLSSTFIRGKTF